MADKNGAIAIIMARGGSKRVPRKNVRSFLGRPMIAWPVAHALACDLFSHVIRVSKLYLENGSVKLHK